MDYAWEKLYLAVLGMARSERPVRQRLADAYVFHLMHIKPTDLPADVRKDLAEIEEAMNRHEAKGDEGNAAASAGKLSELEANELVEKIVGLYNRVAKAG